MRFSCVEMALRWEKKKFVGKDSSACCVAGSDSVGSLTESPWEWPVTSLSSLSTASAPFCCEIFVLILPWYSHIALRYFLLTLFVPTPRSHTTPRHTILQIPTLMICFPTVTNIPIGVAKIAAQTTSLKASSIVASQIATAPTRTFW